MKPVISIVTLGILLYGCTYFENEPIRLPEPPVSEETEDLEAGFTTEDVGSLTAAYWSTADYVSISLSDIVTSEINADDGIFNVNGMDDGVTDFNEGNPGDLTMKAAYDDTYLYIMASWSDVTFNVSQSSWIFNGPEDPEKPGNTDGWTSQMNDDKLVLSFDMGGGKRDVWTWSAALSEPLGFAIDQVFENSTLNEDQGTAMFARNVNGTGNRAGPRYEWDGSQQEYTRELGGLAILDPGFYLLNKHDFQGDPDPGETLYQLECALCHGVEGDGDGFDWSTGVRMDIPGATNRLGFTAMDAVVGNNQHSGSSHWVNLTNQEKEDLTSRLRGFAGVPGYYLQEPTGSAADIHAVSNIILARINTLSDNDQYILLLRRELSTLNNDDIQFNPSTTGQVEFHVYLADNDETNRIGEENLTLTFLQNQQ